MMRLPLLAALVSFLLVFGTAQVAEADHEPGHTTDVFENDDDVVIDVNDNETDTDTGSSGGDPVHTVPMPYKEYKYVISCSTNTVDSPDDVMCTGATAGCAEGELRYRVYTRQRNADGSLADGARWESAGSQCRGSDDPPEGGPVQITTVDISERARQAAPASTVHVQPGEKSYVNVPTNFYANQSTTDASVTVLGTRVDLQFAPSGYAWTFGDDGKGTGAGIKDAAVGEDGAVEHTYRRQGGYEVRLTRSFTVTYQVAGGPSGELPSPVSSTSPDYPLGIGEVQSVVTKIR